MIKIILSAFPYANDWDFIHWRYRLYKRMPKDFFLERSRFLNERNGLFELWCNKLYDRSRDPEYSAAVITRGYYLYRVYSDPSRY